MVQAAQALALLRGRNHAVAEDVADLAADVLRHRLVLTYDALGDGVQPDDLLDRILDTVGGIRAQEPVARMTDAASPIRPGAKARARCRARWSRRSTSSSPAARPARCRASGGRPGGARAPSSPRSARTSSATTSGSIDAAASARTGHPHVRDHVPERTLTTWVLLDVSASMAFGTADRLKSDVAEGVALVIGRLAVRRAGRVGLLTCGAPDRRSSCRRTAAAAQLISLRRALAAGVAPDGHVPEDDALAAGMRRIGRLARGPGLIVVVSDFREGERRRRRRGRSVGERAPGARPPWARALGSLSPRHDVLAVEVIDPREGELPDVGHLVLADPETGKRVEVDSSSAELRRRFAAAELARRDELKSHLRRAHARHVEVATDADWLRALGRSLR